MPNNLSYMREEVIYQYLCEANEQGEILTRKDLVALTSWPRSTIYDTLIRLEQKGLVTQKTLPGRRKEQRYFTYKQNYYYVLTHKFKSIDGKWKYGKNYRERMPLKRKVIRKVIHKKSGGRFPIGWIPI